MWKKIILVVTLLLGSIWWGYSLVFGNNLIFTPDIRFAGLVSRDIYLDNEDLSSTVVIYKSNIDISSYQISSSCNINSQFLESYKTLYFFKLNFVRGASCKNGNIILESTQGKIVPSLTKLTIHKPLQDLSIFLDYSDSQLQKFSKLLQKDIKKYSIYKNYNKQEIAKYFKLLKGQRMYKELAYKKQMIDDILTARTQKYITPVEWGTISDKLSKIPNAGRPYREKYTDGMHHGWDVAGGIWKEVIALDDGIIVRVVRDFDDGDFWRIDYTPEGRDQKAKNLDVLRWKQVWLKTMKWEVVFYSHLSTIPLNLVEWMFVKKGEILWAIGTSWVPEKWYDDYHLHFSVMVNPYIAEKAGTYSFSDYMSWDWKLKGLKPHEVIERQKTIFE